MDEIQQPVIPPNSVSTQPVAPQPEKKEGTAPYVAEGLVVGVILAFMVIGGMYYKSRLQIQIQNKNQTVQQGADLKVKDQQIQDALKQIAKVTVQPTVQPTVTPIIVKTKQDLTTQQTVLDSTDMTSITKGLEDNIADSSQFAL